MRLIQRVLVLVLATVVSVRSSHDYGDALTKSILFFEGQRSGKLPHSQRMTWRKDSALKDGFEIGVSSSPLSPLFNFFLSCKIAQTPVSVLDY